MILVWGATADPPVRAVLDALHGRGAPVLHVDSGRLATMDFDVTREQWESAQWQRVHCVKNIKQLRTVLGDTVGEEFYADLDADQHHENIQWCVQLQQQSQT